MEILFPAPVREVQVLNKSKHLFVIPMKNFNPYLASGKDWFEVWIKHLIY